LEPDRPSAIVRASGHALGRINDRTLAALNALICVPMRRIGFLIPAGGRRFRQTVSTDMISLRRKVKLNLVKKR
jgi:hypothetical protein